ncbi:tellurite resistance TerB family protein [Gilvimarinus xylanilyticus]|uniref:Tellurite resistance TerB family protein n=1 Tax=Gilvimarinus xylanilyticus TaxID=2944139 RepID=A0A9X2I1G8_9GAMM|nr:tellurite resistance TerB family protein [Gilvimarinus xylanilyticus]MCP8897817.1 tellurite resistance TerB family protein [Gilvimarinus xylanilyticus]
MNASSILNQLMKQAGGSSSSGGSGGVDVSKVMQGISSQFSGGKSSGGIDLKSLLGGGALGMMIGSKRGRKMGGKALKYGAIAGVGYLAWKAYQNSQSGSAANPGQPSAQQGQPLEELQGQAQERRGQEILQAMIMAARVDGHIDANERAMLTQEIEALGPDDELHAWIQRQFDAPLDAQTLAQTADSPQAGREIYLVSAIIVDEQNPMERAWLDQLAGALGLPAEVVGELDRQVEEQVRG